MSSAQSNEYQSNKKEDRFHCQGSVGEVMDGWMELCARRRSWGKVQKGGRLLKQVLVKRKFFRLAREPG